MPETSRMPSRSGGPAGLHSDRPSGSQGPLPAGPAVLVHAGRVIAPSRMAISSISIQPAPTINGSVLEPLRDEQKSWETFAGV